MDTDSFTPLSNNLEKCSHLVDSSDKADISSFDILSFNEKECSHLGTSFESEYLLHYLSLLKARTVVVEKKYIDKDYLIDYSYFHSRSLECGKYTKRLHYFKEEFSEDTLRRVFSSDEKFRDSFISILKSSYLGFIVIKPIKKPYKNSLVPLIGRTVLTTYFEEDTDIKPYFLTNEYSASLFGIPLTVKSLPFQVKDNAVSACATTAIWISLHQLNFIFGTVINCPFEITQGSVLFPTEERNFPSNGLTCYQMKEYFNSINLDTEFINIIDESKKNKNDSLSKKNKNDIFFNALRAYLKFKIPIIACIKICSPNGKIDYHAVVISGYREIDWKLTDLYIHDDNRGPYNPIKIENDDLTHWKDIYYEDEECSDVYVEKLLIPLYLKVRLPFAKIYVELSRVKEEIEILRKKRKLSYKFNCELFLSTVNDYKSELLSQNIQYKEKILTAFLPKYLWIIRVRLPSTSFLDYVYDATSSYIKPIANVKYVIQ